MKRSRIRVLIASLASCLVLGGCFFDDQIPDLSDEDMQKVEEYAARLLLKYDENYKATTMSDEAMEAERERLRRLAEVQAQIAEMEKEKAARQEQEAKSGVNDDKSGSDEGSGTSHKSGPVYTDIDDFFGVDGLEIEYTGYMTGRTYPAQLGNNDWQGVVTATSGNMLLIFNYTVTNTTGEDIFLDMVSLKPRFTFRVNNSFSKASMMTILMNDLSGYRDTVPAMQSTDAVLIIEVTEQQSREINALTMIMRYDDQRGEYDLLY
ncbi:MAG: hypothetical protein J6X66_10450 [Lachnospiraceae bacterium]|nr:hypothetical protein [Lachnospiraceae bacterium]